jgi:predicted transcriptional regulator
LSPRAAWRLESLGFDKVFDYTGGKVDWMAYGLPLEKEQTESPMVIDRMTRNVPECRLSDSVAHAKQRAEKLGLHLCPVVNDQDIVLGLVQEDAWKEDSASSVEKVMESAPTTLRPNYAVDEATKLLDQQRWDAVLVTSPDGKLMGILKRA